MIAIITLLVYATWNTYKQTIDPSLWQENIKINDGNPQV